MPVLVAFFTGCAVAVTGCGASTEVSRTGAVVVAPGGLTNGITTDCGVETHTYPQPPAGFDPTKATDAQLNEYGFPPRPPGDPVEPQVKAALRAWLTAMKAWKTTEPAKPICGWPSHPPPSHTG